MASSRMSAQVSDKRAATACLLKALMGRFSFHRVSTIVCFPHEQRQIRGVHSRCRIQQH